MRAGLSRTGIGLLILALAACGGGQSVAPSITSQSSATTDARTPIVVAADMGASDIMAITALLGRTDVELRAIAVTATGLAHCPIGAWNAKRLLRELGQAAVPVGCSADVSGSTQGDAAGLRFDDEHRELADAMYRLGVASPHGPIGESVDVLRGALAPAMSPATVVTIGPLTDLAALLEADPSIAGQIERIVMLGGALDVPGNAGEPGRAVEWNIGIDPRAADVVLGAGIPVLLVPLDATNQVPITSEFVDRLEQAPDAGGINLVAELLTYRIPQVVGSAYFWDPLGALSAIEPRLVQTVEARVAIVGEGRPNAGSLVRDADGHPVQVATGADRPMFEDVFLEALGSVPRRVTAFEVPRPVGTIEISYDGVACTAVAPADPVAGPYEVVFHNGSEFNAGGGIGRIVDGRTFDELREWIETHSEETDPPQPDLGVFLGGVDADAGSDARMPIELGSALHVAVCSPNDGPHALEATLADGALNIAPG